MNPTRRQFLATSALATSSLAIGSARAATEGPGEPLKVALVGCGGRGKGALKDFTDAAAILGCRVEVTALADAFPEQSQQAGSQFKVPPERQFAGYSAYQQAIATDCDYVILATPPIFRPVHFAAAVEAGKHCFIEKPVAVDPVGARAIAATGELASQKGLAVVAGTQRRHQHAYRVNQARVDAGAIGEIRGGVVQWNGRVPWTKPRREGWSDAEYLTRNWVNFIEMSGDHIVEQHIHNIDVAIWFLGRLPVSAIGFGGRARRPSGNQFDFFSVDFDFGDAVHIHSQCRQIAGTYGRVGEAFTGAHGSCFGGGKLSGKEVDIAPVAKDTDSAMVQEHVDLIRSVLDGKPLNEARQVADSTLAAIMGRISAYTGELVRWVDLAEREDSPHYDLRVAVDPLDFEKGTVKFPGEEPPVPGEA